MRIILIFATLILFSIQATAQDRFFTFVESFATYVPVENSNNYTVIGNGLTPLWYNKITCTFLDSSGEIVDVWDYSLDDSIRTEIRNQQSFSDYNGKKILGYSTKTSSTTRFAKRLVLNSEMTHVIDSSWTYSEPDSSMIMFITHQPEANNILHGLAHVIDYKVNFKVISTDTLGNTHWEQTYECTGDICVLRPQQILLAHDGGYILSAVEQRNIDPYSGLDNHDVSTLIKTDSLGEVQWRIHPGGQGMSYTSNDIQVLPTDDGNYLCVWSDQWMQSPQSTEPYFIGNDEATLWFAKIDPIGNKIWEKNIAEELSVWEITDHRQVIYQMIPLTDGNIAISVFDKIIKIDQDANVIWAKNVKPPILQPPNADPYSEFLLKGMIQTSDGGFLCAGEALILPGDVFPEFLQTGFALKLDEYGCLEEGCQLVDIEEVAQEQVQPSIYPNPTSRNITIDYTLSSTLKQLTLSVRNIAGKAVHTQPLLAHEGSVRIELDKNLPAGTYFCHLVADGKVLGIERFVLVR